MTDMQSYTMSEFHHATGQFDDSPCDPSLEAIYRSLLPLIESARKQDSAPPNPSRTSCEHPGKGRKRARSNEVKTVPPNIDQRRSSSDIRDEDVMCGRGARALNHVGNQEFRRLIHSHRSRYFSARKPEKTRISRSIVKAIRARGGRFVKFDADKKSWVDVGDAKAVEKTSQALREGGAEKFRAILSAAKAYVPSTPSSRCFVKLQEEHGFDAGKQNKRPIDSNVYTTDFAKRPRL